MSLKFIGLLSVLILSGSFAPAARAADGGGIGGDATIHYGVTVSRNAPDAPASHLQIEGAPFLNISNSSRSTGGGQVSLDYNYSRPIQPGEHDADLHLSVGAVGGRDTAAGNFIGGASMHIALDSEIFKNATLRFTPHIDLSPNLFQVGLNGGVDIKNPTGNTSIELVLPALGGLLYDRSTGYNSLKTGGKIATEQNFADDQYMVTASIESGYLIGISEGASNAPYILGSAGLGRRLGNNAFIKIQGIFEGQESIKDSGQKDQKDTSTNAFTGLVSAGATWQ